MRSTIKYHVLSIVVGLGVFALTYLLLEKFSGGETGDLAEPYAPGSFRTIDFDDKLDLFRLAATKSLDRDVEVRWVFTVASICSVEAKALKFTEFQELAIASGIPSLMGRADVVDISRWSGTPSEAFSGTMLCDEAKSVDPEALALTESATSFKALQSQGIFPTMLAIARGSDEF
jgi:hypothetical protein